MIQPDDLWYSPRIGPTLARLALTPASWLYAAGWQTYLAIYQLGFKKAQEPHRPVVCIGNLVTGGSGKTPATLFVGDQLLSLGHRVILSLSGYGSPRAEAATLAPSGPLDPAEWGDEPAMVRWLRPEWPLVIGRRRVLAAQLAHASDPGAVLLMDDGFQHLPLRKHLTVLLDPSHPANRACLPAGPYREPRANRRRAGLVIDGETFRLEREPLTFHLPDDPAEVTAPPQADLLCALGQPQGFITAVQAAGVQLRQVRCLPDHDPLTGGTLFDQLTDGLPLLVTAKDWVKLRMRPDLSPTSTADLRRPKVIIAMQQATIQPEQAFLNWLQANLPTAHDVVQKRSPR